MTTGDFWTEDQRHIALDMLREGNTRSDIGAAIGRSRNAVAGRIHRDAEMKAAAPSVPARAHAVSRPGNGGRPAAAVPITHGKPPAPAQAAVAPPTAATAPIAKEPPVPVRRIKRPTPWRIPLIDLSRGDCKWPVEDSPRAVGGQLFCANPVVEEGKPYCPYHDAIAHGHTSEVR